MSTTFYTRIVDKRAWETRLDAWMSLVRTQSRLLDHFERELQREVGIGLPRFDVLAQLDRAGGRLRLGALADAILLSRSGLSRLLDRMERDAQIAREGAPDDARGQVASLTPRGRTLLERARRVHNANIERFFAANISDRDARTIADALRRVRLSLPGGEAGEAAVRWGSPADRGRSAERS